MKEVNFKIVSIICYGNFILISLFTGFDPGIQVGNNFLSFFIEMLKVLPFAFILIGLFDAWVDKEIVRKHLGDGSSIAAYFWVLILGSTTVGGLYVACPVAYSLYNKGSKLSVIFSYMGFASVCRIPMTVFEASFLGMKFTLIKLVMSIPLIIASSILLEKLIIMRRGTEVRNIKNLSDLM